MTTYRMVSCMASKVGLKARRLCFNLTRYGDSAAERHWPIVSARQGRRAHPPPGTDVIRALTPVESRGRDSGHFQRAPARCQRPCSTQASSPTHIVPSTACGPHPRNSSRFW